MLPAQPETQRCLLCHGLLAAQCHQIPSLLHWPAGHRDGPGYSEHSPCFLGMVSTNTTSRNTTEGTALDAPKDTAQLIPGGMRAHAASLGAPAPNPSRAKGKNLRNPAETGRSEITPFPRKLLPITARGRSSTSAPREGVTRSGQCQGALPAGLAAAAPHRHPAAPTRPARDLPQSTGGSTGTARSLRRGARAPGWEHPASFLPFSAACRRAGNRGRGRDLPLPSRRSVPSRCPLTGDAGAGICLPMGNAGTGDRKSVV